MTKHFSTFVTEDDDDDDDDDVLPTDIWQTGRAGDQPQGR